jgi:YD repeat-containing protein
VAERILAVQIESSVQARVNVLAAKASSGELTEMERDEYERIIEQADLLGILKSLARRSLAG